MKKLFFYFLISFIFSSYTYAEDKIGDCPYSIQYIEQVRDSIFENAKSVYNNPYGFGTSMYLEISLHKAKTIQQDQTCQFARNVFVNAITFANHAKRKKQIELEMYRDNMERLNEMQSNLFK